MILVVGGHSRNIGKTSVVCSLIRALPGDWTAVKITQFGHGVCSSSGEDCGCATDPDHPFALTRETNPATGADTSRFLAAGARESLWLRTRAGELGFALPALRRVLARSPQTLLESNSVIQFLKPDLYLAVFDTDVTDFKVSSRQFLDRADALLFRGAGAPGWAGVSSRILGGKPSFRLGRDFELPPELVELVESHRLAAHNSA